MFKIAHFENYQQHPSPFNWLGFFALVVSSLSILSTLYFIFLTKRTELKKSKFEKFCISPLDKSFASLDDIFDKSTYTNIYKQNITDGFLEIQLLLVTLQKVYSKIPLQKIILIIENFTDIIYNSDITTKTDEQKAEYLSTKILIYNEVFQFAIKSEMVLYKRKKKRT